jgi:polysaccharide biosynthesis protein PslH
LEWNLLRSDHFCENFSNTFRQIIMRLLFVTPSASYPPRAGHEIITHNYIKYLAQNHLVDLITFSSNKLSENEDLFSCCRHVEKVDLNYWQSRINKIVGLISGTPLLVSQYKSAKMAQTVKQYLANNKYDVVVFQLTAMAQYKPDWYHGVAILNMVDPLVLNYERSLIRESWHRRQWALNRIMRLKRYEFRQAPRFARVLLLNQTDVSDYQKILIGARLDWVPYAIDVDAYCPDDEHRRCDGVIIITGNMDHTPNVDGIEYFCKAILPKIREQVPSAVLWLVGARPVAAIRKWARDEQIKITGAVPDIRPYLSQAMVSVCPVRLKVGTQTKVLEALAMATPVVTTFAGNHGIGGISGEHLYVSDDPSEFANRVIELLRRKNWSKLSGNGRRFVVENFAWKKSMDKLEKIFDDIKRQSTTQ